MSIDAMNIGTTEAGGYALYAVILPVSLIISLLIIILLTISLLYYKRRFRDTQEGLVRYICACLQLKDRIQADKCPIINNLSDPVTPDEFIKIIYTMMKNTVRMDRMSNRTDKRAIRIIKLAGICKVLIFALTVLQLTGCGKDDLHNTPHPDKGAVKVTTDWSGRSSDAIPPDSYILRIGSEEQSVSSETNTFNSLFLPGTQNLLVWHRTEGITIDGDIATVNTRADGTLEPMPGFLFSAAKELDIQKDDTLKVTVPMMQHIRTLTLTLKLKSGDEQRIASTAATLTNIASVMDLTTGVIAATEGKTTIPTFAPGTDDGRTRAIIQPVLSATMRLLGVTTGARQMLTLKITLTDGCMQTITTDLTEALKNFGGDLKPLELDATLELPIDGQFDGSITGWDVKDDIIIDAD